MRVARSPSRTSRASTEGSVSAIRQAYPWVRRRPRRMEAVAGDERVALGGRDRGMAEQLLHDADVGTVIEQVGGTRVAQHVRAESPGEAHPVAVGGHDPPGA